MTFDSKRWHLENRERLYALHRAWRAENADKEAAARRRRRAANPEKAREASRRWRASNRERDLEQSRRRYLRKKYGLTLEQYQDLFAVQNNKCGICPRPIRLFDTAHLDHCHRTNKIRGFLCSRCNQAIGRFEDDPMLLDKAASYLRTHA